MPSVRASLALFTCLAAPSPGWAQELTPASIMSAPFPSSLLAARSRPLVASLQNDPGVRNVWVTAVLRSGRVDPHRSPHKWNDVRDAGYLALHTRTPS